MDLFVFKIFSDPVYFGMVVLAVGFSVCLHEFCHAYIALLCGDPTAANTGHLTLNPFKQMGTVSLIMLLVLGICWGAVPVNPHLLTPRKRILVSLAGPAVNLLLFLLTALFAGVLINFLPEEVEGSWQYMLFRWLAIAATLNLVLFCLNMLPIPGFDGGAVLMEIFPLERIYTSEFGKGCMIGVVLLLFYSMHYIYEFAYIASGWIISLGALAGAALV